MEEINRARALLAGAGRIVTFSGAGLSAESGIATFREVQTGLWAQYDPTELASPEGFARNPALVIDWYNDRRRKLSSARPNAAHEALARRDDLTHVTQNVDHLLEAAGAARVLHLHGRIDSDRCHRSCGFETPVDIAKPPSLRSCPRCGAPMRPSVVWFGETLPSVVWEMAVEAVVAADALLVVGTSGVVFPAAGLIDLAHRSNTSIIVVNAEPIRSPANVRLIGSAAELVPMILPE